MKKFAMAAATAALLLSVSTGALTEDERQIIADGCLINYYRSQM